MKDLVFMLSITIITAIIWIGIGAKINIFREEPKKVLENPIPISGTIDLEFLEELSSMPSPAL